MSGTEILVILFGLFVGYWVVSMFSKGTGTRSTPESQRVQKPPAEEPDPQLPWYLVLKVHPQANADQIRQAYQILMSQYHPDKVAALGDELKSLCEKKSREINIAYDQALQEQRSASL